MDSDRRLLGAVSDGDTRRAILKGMDLNLAVQQILDDRRQTGSAGPATALVGTSDADLLRLMNEREIRQLPVVDAEGRVVDMAFLTDMVREYESPLRAVVMAGGFGTRLLPLTNKTPKPMLPLGDRPILEWTIDRLKKTGIHRISLTTHYRPEVISEHFGNGDDFGVNINYVHEDQPLGTAGALGLLGQVDGPLLVMNGDIVTHVDFRSMLDYHVAHDACLTVGVRQYEVQVPFGVIECDGANVSSVSEKPQLHFLVNAGVYLLDPSVLRYIPGAQHFDMPDLIQALIKDKRTVVSFPIVEYWLDIGQPKDYDTAQQDVLSGRIS